MSSWFRIYFLLVISLQYSSQECKIEQLKSTESKLYKEFFGWSEPIITRNEDGSVNFECKTGFVHSTMPETFANLNCTLNGYMYRHSFYKYTDLLCKNNGSMEPVVKISPDELHSPIFHCNAPKWSLYRVVTAKNGNASSTMCIDTATPKIKFKYEISLEVSAYSGYLWNLSNEDRRAVPLSNFDDQNPPRAMWYVVYPQKNPPYAAIFLTNKDYKFDKDLLRERWQCERFIFHPYELAYKCDLQDFLPRLNRLEHIVIKKSNRFFEYPVGFSTLLSYL